MSNGPLSSEDLIALLRAVMPEHYIEPLLANPETKLVLEGIAQMFERASVSVDKNTQAMFILPWSGQSAPPSAGEAYATTTLEVSRTTRIDESLPLVAGTVFQQWLNDYGPSGPQLVTSERRYLTTHPVAFAPGDAGPITVEVRAEKPGYGYNLPAPGTIARIVQSGAGLTNTGASVVAGLAGYELQATELPDVPALAHVGAMVLFISGANAGRTANVVGYAGPVPGQTGGSLYLIADAVLTLTGIAGTFEQGEEVVQTTGTGATGKLFALANGRAVVRVTQGTFVAGNFTGATSGATATVSSVDVPSSLTPETGTAEWEVLSFEDDYGLSSSNPESPEGGLSAMLDELGGERDIYRADLQETDDAYRVRVSKPIDVVSPNAIRRAANHVLKPFALSICLREVGRPLFPGLFHDVDFFDYGRITFGLSGGGVGFKEREWVHQDLGGFQTRGRISVTVDNSGTVFHGVDYVTGPGFLPGPLIGETSGTVDTIVGPVEGDQNEKRFNVLLTMSDSRGFFLVGVPPFPTAPIGTFYDALLADNFHDALLEENFFDGWPSPTDGAVYGQVYKAVDRVRAAGVAFEVYVEAIGCV